MISVKEILTNSLLCPLSLKIYLYVPFFDHYIPTATLIFIFYKMPVIFIDVEEMFYDGRTPGGNGVGG